MPNCDFLAIKSDLTDVLDFVFDCGEFVVYEAYSEFGAEIRSFDNTPAVYQACGVGNCIGNAASVFLQLLAKETGIPSFDRISLNPDRCNGHDFRYVTGGWGLIQLQLGGIGPKGIVRSHTNHNSESRALKWEASYPQFAPVLTWNWLGVASASRKLNRFIHKIAVEKQGSHCVLPEASQYLAGRG